MCKHITHICVVYADKNRCAYIHTYIETYIHGDSCMSNTHIQTDIHVCLQTNEDICA